MDCCTTSWGHRMCMDWKYGTGLCWESQFLPDESSYYTPGYTACEQQFTTKIARTVYQVSFLKSTSCVLYHFTLCNQRYCRVLCTFIDLARFLHVITSNWRSGATLDRLLKLLFVDCWMALLNSDTVKTYFVLVSNLKLKLLFMMTILESTHNNFCNRPK